MFGYMGWDQMPREAFYKFHSVGFDIAGKIKKDEMQRKKLIEARDKAEKTLKHQLCENFVEELIAILQPDLRLTDAEKIIIIKTMLDLTIESLDKKATFTLFDTLSNLSDYGDKTPKLLEVINYIMINAGNSTIKQLIVTFHEGIKNITNRKDLTFLLECNNHKYPSAYDTLSNKLAKKIFWHEDEEEQIRESIVAQESQERESIITQMNLAKPRIISML